MDSKRSERAEVKEFRRPLSDPLVSIIVVTYNSSKYILETLESAKAQTYNNIEIVISDDGSTDSMVEICKEWLSEHLGRFRTTKCSILENSKRIVLKCNLCLLKAKGEFIKNITGDDVLMVSNNENH